jgi:signal transduction histidine kinase
MDRIPRRGLPARAALTAFLVSLPALVLVGALALALESRADVAQGMRDMDQVAAERAASGNPTTKAAADALLAGRGAPPGRVIAPDGRVLAQRGSEAIWAAGGAPWFTRVVTVGLPAAMRDQAIEAEAPLASGGRLVLRRSVGPREGRVGTEAIAVLVAALVLSGVLAALAAWRAARDAARLRTLAHVVATGAPGGKARTERWPGEWRLLVDAVGDAAAQREEMQRTVDARVGTLAAVTSPLAVPVAMRTPAGGATHNQALDHLLAGLAPEDEVRLDDAVRDALLETGAVARRVALGDGRILDVDAWTVPGGRVASVLDRAAQDRLARLRAELAGAATRHLRTPVAEIQAVGTELFRELPVDGAGRVQRILRAADRLDRLTARLLRGGPHDPDRREPREEPLGAAGLLWDLAREWDEGLKPRALRVELELAEGLPVARTDPALVAEILTELVENAAKFTPRGGTVKVVARRAAGGDLELAVLDTGEGMGADLAERAREPFYRGPNADALPGAGLGLGVAAALAERLGGRLEVVADDHGEVRLTLPAEPAGAPVAEPVISA